MAAYAGQTYPTCCIDKCFSYSFVVKLHVVIPSVLLAVFLLVIPYVLMSVFLVVTHCFIRICAKVLWQVAGLLPFQVLIGDCIK
jgi:hypothetical protein